MITFKATVRFRRKDGFYPVYIRVTKDKKPDYIQTDKMLTNESLGKSKEIKDPYVIKYCNDKILEYTKKLNMIDTERLTVKDVVNYLTGSNNDISFSDYARKHIDKMIDNGERRNAKNYKWAIQSLELYAGTTQIMFSQLTSKFINGWIESLGNTKRAKEMYPICLRQVFKEAIKELNDYDKGIIIIKTNPWIKTKIPQADKPEKIAITPKQCREFFSAPLPESKLKEPLLETARDVAMMVLCLAGINTVDIYNLKKKDYNNGIIGYKRAKTRKSRKDDAYIEMRVPSIIQYLFDKYKSSEDDEYLFSFHKRYCDSDSFGVNISAGLRKISKNLGVEEPYCVYTFRHTWGTVAQNHCGASIHEVGFAMNHSQRETAVTRGYIKIDFSPAWILNERVIDYIFFTEDESEKITEDDDPNVFRIAAKYMIKAGAYFRGKKLAELCDIGFNNVEEVISSLMPLVPSEIPERSTIHFKIEIVDKNLSQTYERTKRSK